MHGLFSNSRLCFPAKRMLVVHLQAPDRYQWFASHLHFRVLCVTGRQGVIYLGCASQVEVKGHVVHDDCCLMSLCRIMLKCTCTFIQFECNSLTVSYYTLSILDLCESESKLKTTMLNDMQGSAFWFQKLDFFDAVPLYLWIS